MNQPPTTADTWAPDWEQLAGVAYQSHFEFPTWPDVAEIEHELWRQTAYAIIAEYEKDRAAAGYVMVRWEDLAIALAVIEGGDRKLAFNHIREAYDRLTAAVSELMPKGDAA